MPEMSEHDEQATLFQLLHYHERMYPELRLLFAIPNGGKRNIGVARKLKLEGVKPGVPDLFLPVARGGYHGLFIEMKRTRGGEVSKAQKAWLKELQSQGYHAVVCNGHNAALKALDDYLNAPNPEDMTKGFAE